MADTKTLETPILIVGGGPVGLALATDLGWRGAPCLLIEQGEGPIDHPRATAINARSMEFMRRWGIGEAVCDAAYPDDFPHTALYCTTLNGFEIARIDRHHHGGRGPSETSPERAQRCNQLFLDPILQKRAADFQYGVTRSFHCHWSILANSGGQGATIQFGWTAFGSPPGHPLNVMTRSTPSFSSILP